MIPKATTSSSGLCDLWWVLWLLPRNYLSFVCGCLLNLPLPKPLARLTVSLFVRQFKIDLQDAERRLEDYRSIGELFTRDLRCGTRPLGGRLVSPVDGELIACGEIDESLVLEVKGRNFSCEALIRDPALAAVYRGGTYFVFYLSPRDYHHIHSPVEGAISGVVHVEGTLWPVNGWSLRNIDGVFVVNERVTSIIQTAEFGVVSVVKVGATNVGSIRLRFDQIVSNKNLGQRLFRSSAVHRKEYASGVPVKLGEKIASFELGSTVILLIEKGVGNTVLPGPILYGQTLELPDA